MAIIPFQMVGGSSAVLNHAGKVYLIKLHLDKQETGVARVFEVTTNCKIHFLLSIFRKNPNQPWALILDGLTGEGETPRDALKMALIKKFRNVYRIV